MKCFSLTFVAMCCSLFLPVCDSLGLRTEVSTGLPSCTKRDAAIQKRQSIKKMRELGHVMDKTYAMLSRGFSAADITNQFLDTYSTFVPPKCMVKVLKSAAVPWMDVERCIRKTSDISPGCAACGVSVLRTAVNRCNKVCVPCIESATAMGTFSQKFHSCLQCIKPSFAELSSCSYTKSTAATDIFTRVFGPI